MALAERHTPHPVQRTAPSRIKRHAALVLGISATIVDERVRNVLGPDASIWAIEAEAPDNDVLKRSADLAQFRRQLGTMLDQIKAAHGDDIPLHVFPALPMSAAIEVGRVAMPKADMPMIVYDQNRRLGGFVRALGL